MAGSARSCQRLSRVFHGNVRSLSQKVIQPGQFRQVTSDFVSPPDAPRERQPPFTDCVILAETSQANRRLSSDLDFLTPADAARVFVPPLQPRCAAVASGGSAGLLWCGTRSGAREAGAAGFRRWAEQRRVGGVWAEPRGVGAVLAEPRRYLHHITVEEEKVGEEEGKREKKGKSIGGKPEHRYWGRAAVEGGFCVPTIPRSPFPPPSSPPHFPHAARAQVSGDSSSGRGLWAHHYPPFPLPPPSAPPFHSPLPPPATICSPFPSPPSFAQPEHKYWVTAAVAGSFYLNTTPPFPLPPLNPFLTPSVLSCSPSTTGAQVPGGSSSGRRIFVLQRSGSHQWRGRHCSHPHGLCSNSSRHVHCYHCQTDGRLPDGLRLLLRLEGPLSTEQKERLLEIAGKCPVKQMMLGKMRQAIKTTLVDA
ncbi:unnamed protein product [Closterium sp. Naga37s-1]|nr:unnamed protein product [Closterium sp. Naga37s-1]